MPRTRRDNDSVRRFCFDLVEADSVIEIGFGSSVVYALYLLDDVIGERVIVVDYENGHGAFSLDKRVQ